MGLGFTCRTGSTLEDCIEKAELVYPQGTKCIVYKTHIKKYNQDLFACVTGRPAKFLRENRAYKWEQVLIYEIKSEAPKEKPLKVLGIK